jgi:uncharacterized protein with LGFP repeats
MSASEPSKVRRDVALVATTAVVAGVLTAPAGVADDRIDPPSTLRLAPEPGSGVAAVDVPLRSRFQPAGGGRFRTQRMGTSEFSMVGFTWRDRDAGLRVRVRDDGRWRSWKHAEPMPDIPDPSAAEGRRARSGTELMWVGGSDAVQVESADAPAHGLEMTLIEPGVVTAPARVAAPRAAADDPLRPGDIRSRKDWGADDRLRDGDPVYNRTIKQVHVHHTVNSNGYSRADVPGLIRGMYRYHTQNLGWSDIGYNFLVDRFGRTWVGRAGGAGRPVRGAHTLGFNHSSTGVAVIGNFEKRARTRGVAAAIVRLAAWKLHMYGRDPRRKAKVWSHGSDRFPAGTQVLLPRIDGHRDTNYTACPGKHLYERLPNLRRRTAYRIDRLT